MSTTSGTSGNKIILGYLIGALGASFFATKGILIKLALIENVDAITTLTWRMIIALPFFILIGYFGYRRRVAQTKGKLLTWKALATVGAIGALGYYLASYLDFAGLTYISAQFDRLILLTYPIFVVLIGAIFQGRPLQPKMLIALFISYGGLAVIFARDLQLDGHSTIIGASLVLGAALSYAVYQVLAKPHIDRIGARLFTSIAMTAAGLVVIVHFFIVNDLSDLSLPPRAMMLMFAVATISTVVPAYLISISIGMVGPEPTAVIGNVSTLVTIGLAVSVLGEPFTIWHAAGAAMVLIGVISFTQMDRVAKEAAARKVQIPS
ncbi:DMT family transporter [uncultured Maritalea sp.]|uniref:DMT family transporter n=1 Tax=uncultured Maritalea sp. TaxID=757249 RepID=UPI0026129381|nr:DMT family transporter [uncultured Maritalea sp.]